MAVGFLPKNPLACSFCGKSQSEVKMLIAGPTVYICNECVALCCDIIGYNVAADDKEAPIGESQTPPPEAST